VKNLTLLMNESAQRELADLLRGLKPVLGFTFIHVEGHGTHTGGDAFLSDRDRVVGYVPRLRVDILLNEKDVDTVLIAISEARNRLAGQGIYWVTPAERHGTF